METKQTLQDTINYYLYYKNDFAIMYILNTKSIRKQATILYFLDTHELDPYYVFLLNELYT